MTRPPEDRKSRSQLKREHQELQKLAEQLAQLSSGQLDRVPISDRTREAILAAGPMTRAALRRQLKYVGQLLVNEDVDAVRAALAGELRPSAEKVAIEKETERWRDRLLTGEPGPLDDLAARYPDADPKLIRQLVRNAGKERDLEKPPRSARRLFRYLRELIDPPES